MFLWMEAFDVLLEIARGRKRTGRDERDRQNCSRSTVVLQSSELSVHACRGRVMGEESFSRFERMHDA